LDNRRSLGYTMDRNKSTGPGRNTNVDTLDTAPFTGRPANEPVLEGINPTGICMHADIRCVAVMGNVIFYFGFRMFDFGFKIVV
jgi:hypothetical protein